MNKTKSFKISKFLVLEAYKKVRANQGAAGVDEQSIKEFENNLEDNLYKIWNKMSSGSYFPPPVKQVEIPKDNGGTRTLGIPTVTDRIAQMVVKLYIEPAIDLSFHQNSYGYRPRLSAKDALEITRRRCWKYDWVIDLDVKGFFDNMNHELTMKALEHHTKEKWVLLYVKRWLEAPMISTKGEHIEREKGTPQGGVISPLLANLFMHYAFDKWLERNHSQNPFARYADDAVIHCETKEEAETLLEKLKERMQECFLELHPEKTKIVYCKDANRKEDHDNVSFDFLGYTFRPRRAKSRKGIVFLNFLPAVSGKAKKKIREKVRGWKLQLKTQMNLNEIATWINPQVKGWINYYGAFYRSALYHLMGHIEYKLCLWARKKYKRFKERKEKARIWLRSVQEGPLGNLFVHWQFKT